MSKPRKRESKWTDLTAGIEQARLADAGEMLVRGSKAVYCRHRLRRVGTRDQAAIASGLLSCKFL
jgi:hypothetical protein